MGNVQASSNLPPMPPNLTPIPTPRTPQKLNSENRIKNPGSVGEIHNKCKELFPMTFEGIQLVINKGLSNHFLDSHSLLIGATSQISVKFGSLFGGTNQVGSGNFSHLLRDDFDHRGNISTNVNVQPWDNLKLKLNTQFQDFKTKGVQTTAEYKTNRYTATLRLVNPDLFNYTGIYISQYLYALNNKTSVGAEVIHQRSPQIPNGHITVFNVLGRYIYNDATTISTTMSVTWLQCCYHFKASKQLQFGVHIEGSFLQRDINATFAYQTQIPKSDIKIKGSIDRKWNVSTTLEKRLHLMPFTFTLSTNFCPAKHQLRMGVGLLVG
ncbi:mitochondrial import receptor subunit TOM40 homolog 2-like [Metopolophium dirhodum]|uniref:mitochondrial import receptor subunit TOM40 homolog 2-like n=1 Tax=Metopolophium dirhodum TaxID=44670 RepID=UPI00298FE906|nr:mitochondrial import receptor subunit TOM40 homolog 2-like [Metopolophium dirhodum]XP_060860258.1 mitochondrial import receptor subunit TOM40 homolog 2-like [Metopolophium dirhodum]